MCFVFKVYEIRYRSALAKPDAAWRQAALKKSRKKLTLLKLQFSDGNLDLVTIT